MYGGKLTARQYGVLLNQPETDAAAEREFNKLYDYKTMMKSRETIRNGEEIVESYRREKVHKGIWSEVDSYALMQQTLEDIQRKYPTKKAWDIAMREERKRHEDGFNAATMETYQEREYYFDEGLGESLNEHVQSIKE